MTLYYLRKGNQGYYRPDSQGYTDDMLQAGLFSEWTAKGVVEATHGEVTMIPECPPEVGSSISVGDLIDALSLSICATDSLTLNTENSRQRAGWESNLAYLRKHKKLTICP